MHYGPSKQIFPELWSAGRPTGATSFDFRYTTLTHHGRQYDQQVR